MDNELQKAIGRQEYIVRATNNETLRLIVNAARKVANPEDELWWCKAHARAIDKFDKLTPIECLYVGRPGDCKPVPALIVLGITKDTE